MKKIIMMFLIAAISFGWGIKNTENYVLGKVIKGLEIIYNVNGDILYLDDTIQHLKGVYSYFKKYEPEKVNFPFNLKELRYHITYDPVKKKEVMNTSLALLEYGLYITAFNFQHAKEPKLKEKLKKVFNVMRSDFQSLLKMSIRYVNYTDELYYPMFFKLYQYKKFIVTPSIYNFVYNSGIVKKRPLTN